MKDTVLYYVLGNKLMNLHKEKENCVIYKSEYQWFKKQCGDVAHLTKSLASQISSREGQIFLQQLKSWLQ